jgi:hypothetical protein
MIEMISNPYAVKDVTRINQMREYEDMSIYIRSESDTYWTGYINYKYSDKYAAILSCCAGRDLQSPHCYGIKEILMKILDGKYNIILKNLNLETVSNRLDDRLKADLWLYQNPVKLLEKNNANKNKDGRNSLSVCMICEQIFNTNDKESDEIKLHPCKVLNSTDIININSLRCQEHVAKKIETLNPDQHEIFDCILLKKNMILFAAGGCGKTHIIKLVNLFLRQNMSHDHVIVVAMLSNIAGEINGKTLYSYFRLGIIDPHIEGKYVYSNNPNIEAFIKEKFTGSSGISRILKIQVAKIIIIDEVILFFLFLFIFSDYSLIEVFMLRIL